MQPAGLSRGTVPECHLHASPRHPRSSSASDKLNINTHYRWTRAFTEQCDRATYSITLWSEYPSSVYCPTGPTAKMDAILAALVALMALAAAMTAVLSTFSKAAIFAILAIAPCLYRYRRRLYIIIKTLPRDVK